MWKKIIKGIFPALIALTALSVSASAAYYSVTGLSKLFAGAAFAVMVMAGSLEVAKLIIATLLHQYWTTMNKVLRVYLTLATIILIGITSAGIYGFLSSAYQETATKAGVQDKQIELLETKKESFTKIKAQYDIEKESTTQSITSLRNALGNNMQSYVDAAGNVISYSSSANRRAYENQLETAITKDEKLTEKIQTLNDTLLRLETQIVEVQSNSELASELGPLKYLSGLTGQPMDKIINVLLLIIIFVFDPLAISLVVTANFAFKQAYKKEEMLPEEEDVIGTPEKDWVENWPDDIDEELEEASLTDFQKWEEEEEPYQIYVSGSQDKNTEWQIVDEEKENLKQELDSQIASIHEQASKLQANPNYSTWRKSKEIQQMRKTQNLLQEKRKKLDGDDDLVIKYT